MKQKLIAVFAFLLLLGVSTANAVPIWFDAQDGNGAIRMDLLGGVATSYYDVTLNLGADHKLSDGDSFTETYTLGLSYGKLFGSQVAGYGDSDPGPGFAPSLYATVSLSGTIQGWSDGTLNGLEDTDETNFGSAILDDSFYLDFNSTLVDPTALVTLYYDADTTDATAATQLGVFGVLGGNSQPFVNVNGTLTSDMGINLLGSALTAGVFYLDNLGVQGADISGLAPNVLLMALADGSNNLLGYDVQTIGDDIVKVTIGDNGTTVPFQPTPEPATLMLLGFGLLGIAATGRKRINS
jgi:hypothetical protein